jgi:hypothetical protein
MIPLQLIREAFIDRLKPEITDVYSPHPPENVQTPYTLIIRMVARRGDVKGLENYFVETHFAVFDYNDTFTRIGEIKDKIIAKITHSNMKLIDNTPQFNPLDVEGWKNGYTEIVDYTEVAMQEKGVQGILQIIQKYSEV